MALTLDPVLQQEILSHVVENLSTRRSTATGGNLILAIEGRPGEGKSYHCKAVLGMAGIALQRFSLSEFESQAAGVPSTRLVERYLAASESVQAQLPAVLLLEDVDLAFGPGRQGVRAEIVQYTMNRDLLVGALMALCDSPTAVQVPCESVRADRGSTVVCNRVPIVITGNALMNVYGALVRHGRTRLIRWSPAPSTRASVVRSTFPTLREDEAHALLDEFDQEPISFWSAVALEIESTTTRQTIASVLDRDPEAPVEDLVRAVESVTTNPPTFDGVERVARRLQRERWREDRT